MRGGRLSSWARSAPPRSLAEARAAAAALASLMQTMQALAAQGRSVLTELLGAASAPRPWVHAPPHDACDRAQGYRWYYHGHPGHAQWPGEHGHFHLFADPDAGATVTHLLAIAVDAHGRPLGLVAPNVWVTDERWRPAATVLRLIDRYAVDVPRRLHRVHAWLAQLLRAFRPQVRALLMHRDARLAAYDRRARRAVLEDRRIQVLSRCRIDLLQQAAQLDRCLSPHAYTRGDSR